MKNKFNRLSGKNMIWGILLLLVAIAILLLAIFPGFGPVGVPAWKWLLGLLLLWWLLDHLILGLGLRERLDIFLPLALLFMLFERHLAPLLGKPDDFVNNWLILGAAILLSVAVKLIFSKKSPKNSNSLSDAVVYLDAAEKKNRVRNRLGETNVYYQNTNVIGPDQPVILHAENSLGELVVHIPADWRVTVKASNCLGEISVRKNPDVGREFILEGSNSLGEISVV